MDKVYNKKDQEHLLTNLCDIKRGWINCHPSKASALHSNHEVVCDIGTEIIRYVTGKRQIEDGYHATTSTKKGRNNRVTWQKTSYKKINLEISYNLRNNFGENCWEISVNLRQFIVCWLIFLPFGTNQCCLGSNVNVTTFWKILWLRSPYEQHSVRWREQFNQAVNFYKARIKCTN